MYGIDCDREPSNQNHGKINSWRWLGWVGGWWWVGVGGLFMLQCARLESTPLRRNTPAICLKKIETHKTVGVWEGSTANSV